jgi:hypothetical protein
MDVEAKGCGLAIQSLDRRAATKAPSTRLLLSKQTLRTTNHEPLTSSLAPPRLRPPRGRLLRATQGRENSKQLSRGKERARRQDGRQEVRPGPAEGGG